jgi:hypothetical protein
MKQRNQYEKFRNLADSLLAVPHAEIKAKLDEEKKIRVQKKQKKAKK